MTLFQEIKINAGNKDSLELFIVNNIDRFHDLYNAHYSLLIDEKNDIREFIELKRGILEQIDYSLTQTRAFVSILFDFCERFGFISIVGIENALTKKNLNLGKRREAAKLFLLNIRDNNQYIDRFSEICELLQYSIEFEEDNDIKAITTFSNYLAKIIRDTAPIFFSKVKDKIVEHIAGGAFPFLVHDVIAQICSVDITDSASANSKVQDIIEQYLGHSITVVNYFEQDEENLLIENNTEYVIELSNVNPSFDSIRAISVKNSDGRAFTNRGVKILESEIELFAYMRRVGNMHKAKLDTSLGFLPSNFSSKVDIIDWGCGQGIASMIFLEKFGSDIINKITLIEPSEVAIKRATMHLRKYSPTVAIKTICKKLDDLTVENFQDNSNKIKIHLFSNILDIDDYSQSKLIDLINTTQSSENYFVCVSPYIDDVKTDRINSFIRYFENNYYSYELLGEETNGGTSNDEYWCCNNKYKGQMGVYCSHKKNGCGEKWTRVIRVFKVNL